MPVLKILNSSSSTSSAKQQCRAKTKKSLQALESKRNVLEQAERARVQRIYKDIEDILKREKEYTKDVLEKVLPVKIVWNESLFETLSSLAPFRIEKVDKPLDPEVILSVEEEEKLEESV
jgi:hypothetical protein